MTQDSQVDEESGGSSRASQDAAPLEDGGKWFRRPSLWVSSVILAVLLWLAANWVLLVTTAVLVATCLRGAGAALAARSRLSVGQGIVAVMFGIVALGGILVVIVLPEADRQAQELSERLPEIFAGWQSALEGSAWGARLREHMPDSSELTELGRMLLRNAGGAFSSVFGFFLNGFLIGIISIYLAFEAPRLEQGFTRLFPARRRGAVTALLEKLSDTIRSWVLAQMLSMTILGISVYVGLKALGVPLALLMGVLAALLAIIPNIGPTLSVIPPLLLALAQSPWTALWVLLLYVFVQMMEGNFVTPFLMRKAISMPASVLLSMQVLLVSLLGFWGLLLAAPLSAVAMVAVEELHMKQMDRAG